MKALLLVDIQNDFSPSGALPVKEGDKIIPYINDLQESFDLIVATQDWHPANHESFAANHNMEPGQIIDLYGIEQILWPNHCVQNTEGAKFMESLDLTRVDHIFQKGRDPKVDSYSGFFDNDHKSSTGLSEYFKEKSVTGVVIVGLATDYCVKYTAIDAVDQGFETQVLVGGCRGVELKVGDIHQALVDMKVKGVQIV